MEIIIKGTDLQELVGKLNQICSKPASASNANAFKLAYRVKRIMDKLFSAYKEIDKKRVELVEKIGIEDKKAKQFQVPPERLDEFNKVMDHIKEEPIKIEFEPICLDLINSCGIAFTLGDLANLEQFIEKEK